jgi:NAD(P)-dependent dehydrogenase (short-subunit alcohol dehydrogenase family)
MLALGVHTHLITSHFALPLLIRQKNGLVVEVTDGTEEFNRGQYRVSMFYDLVKTSVIRMAWALSQELKPYQCTAVSLTPGWMRSEIMLEHFGVTEDDWRKASAQDPHFLISETPRYTITAKSSVRASPRTRSVTGKGKFFAESARGHSQADRACPCQWHGLLAISA